MDRSRSPRRMDGAPDGAPAAPAAMTTGSLQRPQNFPCFPRWTGPMGSAVIAASNFAVTHPGMNSFVNPTQQIISNSQFSQPSISNFQPHQPSNPIPPSQPHPFSQSMPCLTQQSLAAAPSKPFSPSTDAPTYPLGQTPSSAHHLPCNHLAIYPPAFSTPSSRPGAPAPRIPPSKTGEHWSPDLEHYDTNKLNGLVLPRAIRTSQFAQKIDVKGCDPLQIPLPAV